MYIVIFTVCIYLVSEALFLSLWLSLIAFESLALERLVFVYDFSLILFDLFLSFSFGSLLVVNHLLNMGFDMCHVLCLFNFWCFFCLYFSEIVCQKSLQINWNPNWNSMSILHPKWNASFSFCTLHSWRCDANVKILSTQTLNFRAKRNEIK